MGSKVAFVTGSTGLLGNNLVRLLVRQGWQVRALARSPEKAASQFGGLELEIIEGDITDIRGFSSSLLQVEAVFHTAAYFRDSFKGGSHGKQLYAANVEGTRNLLKAAYDAGVRKFVQTSSIAVLDGPPGTLIDETMLRKESERNDYYRSKILADKEVHTFLETHPDLFAVFVLPGWMHGPGDAGPTAAGQTTLDFLKQKLPGIPPGTVALVDARDVALAMLRALERGTRGERYLAAGRSMDMEQVFAELEAVSGVRAPRRRLPILLLYIVAATQELRARLTAKPALLSWATVRLLVRENGRSSFSDNRFHEALGLHFRPARETLGDEIAWYRERELI